jgi:hypothetical protein
LLIRGQIRVHKAVALDFYDGAVGGFVELVGDDGSCSWFRYELFSWDNGQNTRVFGLAAAKNVSDILASASDAQWPVWFPLAPCTITDYLEHVRIESSEFVAVILCDGYFKRITGFAVFTPEMKEIIPHELPNYGTDNFDFWQSRLLHSS